VPDVLYIHPAKHDVDAGFRDLGFYARGAKGCQACTGGLALVRAFLRRHQRGPGLQVGSTQSPRCARRHFGFTVRGRDSALLPRGRLCHSGRCRGAPAEPGQAPLFQRQRTPTPNSQPDLPGEDEKAFRQTMRVAGRIRRSHPPDLLKMVNMAHTLDPCSPISRRPQRFSIDIGLRSCMDYFKYCEQTLAIQAGEGPWKVRGFAYHKDWSLRKMVRQWNEFCAEEPSSCFRVPESW
jgi:hypothetical protein